MRVTLLMLVACGCGTAAQHGSFVRGQADLQRAMAADAADKIVADYARQDGSITLLHPAADPFGKALSSQLRQAGLQVRPGGKASASTVRLSYVADAIKGTKLLRVTLEIDGEVLSRAYKRQGNGVVPAGPWVRSIGGIGGAS